MSGASRQPKWLTRILSRSSGYQLDIANVFLLAAIFVFVLYFALAYFSLVPLKGVWYDSMQGGVLLLLACSAAYMLRWTNVD